jgi:uncharacterized protein YjiS (DUF1127 family)
MTHITTNLACPMTRPCSKGFWAAVLQRLYLQRQRRLLGQLGPDALRDIGLTQTQAQAESRRKAWDAPHQWMC